MMFRIEIKNWDKFNPRKDVKKPTWFRLENDWESDPDFYDYTAEQKLLWIHLLSSASREHGKTGFKLNTVQSAAILKMSEPYLIETLQSFAGPDKEFISLRELPGKNPNGCVQNPNAHDRKELSTTEVGDRNPNVHDRVPPTPTASRDGWNPNAYVQNLHATGRDGTKRNDNNPPKPPHDIAKFAAALKDPSVSPREHTRIVKQTAVEVTARLIAALHSGLDDTAAKASVGDLGWEAMRSRYGTFSSFSSSFRRSYEKGNGTTHEAQLRNWVIAFLGKLISSGKENPLTGEDKGFRLITACENE